MKRQPSIHITEKELANILEDINPNIFFDDIAAKEMAKEILIRASKKLYHRSVSVSNAKMERDIKTLVKSSESDASLLSNLIYLIRRRKSKLYTTKKIEKGTKDYTQLKELTKVCIEFCNTFNLEKKQGFTRYLELGIPKISSSLNFILKLVNMAEKIYQLQEAQDLIDKDINSEETKKIHDIYVDLISKKTGIVNDYTKDPITYSHFIELNKITDKLDIPADIFIQAQFHGLSWTNSFPEPNQLIGDKAIERLNKYMYEKKITVKNKEDDKPNNILLKIKAKHDKNRDQ